MYQPIQILSISSHLIMLLICEFDNILRLGINTGEWTNEWEVVGASQSDYQKFGTAQVQVFGQATFGWSFWTYQNQLNRWSFQQSVEQGYLEAPSSGWP